MTSSLQAILHAQRAEILAEWLDSVHALWATHGPRGGIPREWSLHLHALFDDILSVLERPATEVIELDPEGPLGRELRQLVAEQARLNAGPNEAVGMVLSLKRLIARHAVAGAPAAATEDLLWIEKVFDQVTLYTFQSFVDIREQLITQQSLSLLELSTPVLRLWHRILLLPLVGVIDTVRARQITERLLEAIARYEARVTILDLTGVPVLDTSVAQHLMKTIDAARLLGTRIVLTGISPEGAQTLTKLGIKFDDVISRATLRAGIAEALLVVGLRIGPMEERRA